MWAQVMRESNKNEKGQWLNFLSLWCIHSSEFFLVHVSCAGYFLYCEITYEVVKMVLNKIQVFWDSILCHLLNTGVSKQVKMNFLAVKMKARLYSPSKL